MVPDNSPGIPRAPGYSGGSLLNRDIFAYGALTRCGSVFHRIPLISRYSLSTAPITPRGASPRPRFGLFRFRSPLLAESLLFSLPPGT